MLSPAVGYEGRVMGIDLSEKMLQLAERNISKMGLLAQLAPLRQQHLARVETLITEDGLWMDVEVHVSPGQVP